VSYLKEILKQIESGQMPVKAGEVLSVNVSHDANCAHWSGRACNCAPDIRAQKPNRATRRAARKDTRPM
jgi:hypothetical protein